MIYQHDREEKKWNPGQVNTHACPQDLTLDWEPWMFMRRYLVERGLNTDVAMYNKWRPVIHKGLRIYIPATTRIAGHTYWQARGIEGQELRYDSPFGPRRDALVVVNGKVKPRSIACVVEGPMDALAMAELTGVTGVALMGLSPSSEALEHLAILCQEYAHVFCLPDRADIDGMFKIQNYLATRGILSSCKVPLDKKDVAEYTIKERRKLIDG